MKDSCYLVKCQALSKEE